MKKVIFILLIFISNAFAEDVYIPESLKDWKNWVEQAHPEWNCAKHDSSFTCSWPGKLNFKLSDTGARFNIKLSMLAEGELPLPGKIELRPSDIEVKDTSGNLISANILSKDSLAFLKLKKGDYEISGSFTWDQIPKNLPIPSSYGVLQVIKNEQEIQFNRTSDGAWLKGSDDVKTEKSLFLSVFRKITDGSPLTIETLIKVRATGAAHTINLGKILPTNSTPVETQTSLSHQLTPEGNLTIQIKPGNYDVFISSVLQQPVKEITLPKPSFEHWPEYEVWSMYDDKNYRSVEFLGGKAVTASNTELPGDWTTGATYYVNAGEQVELKELSRGITREEQNNLSLSRQMWLDLDGEAFTVSDNISAQINTGFRINAIKGLELGRVQINNQDQQITKDPVDNNLGVEIRERNISLNAVSRLKNESSLPAIGWNSSISSFNGTLSLGPSWKLLHISGAQSVTGSWLSSWTLMDLFVGILMVVASYRLYGKVFAALVLGALLLNKGEHLEPRLMLIHLVIAVLIYKLTREASDYWKNVSSIYLFATFAAWIVMVATFSKLQLTQLLYPQLQAGTRYRTILQELLFFIEGWFLSWPSLGLILLLVVLLFKWIRKSATQFQIFWRIILSGILIFTCIPAVFGILAMFAGPKTFGSGSQYMRDQAIRTKNISAPASTFQYNDYRSDVVMEEAVSTKAKFDTPTGKLLQTGPALPNWSWRSFYFTLDGPISPEREITFYLVKPSIERIFSLIRLSLLIILSVMFWKNMGYKIPKIQHLVILFLLFNPSNARADYPSDKLLSELSTRLESKLCQNKDCATIEKLELAINDDRANIKISYTSDGVSGITLPGPLDQLQIDKVEQDGQELNALRRNDNNFLIAKTESGKHSLNISAKLASSQVINLEFPNPPLKTIVEAKNWQVDGLLPGGIIKGTLQLTPSSSNGQEVLETILPSWFIVTRKLNLGDKFNVTTTIYPEKNLLRPTTVKFKALENEKIATEKALLTNGVIEARFDVGMNELVFESSLTPKETLELKANNNSNVTEFWEISCSPLYNCKSQGIAPNNLFSNDEKYTLSWMPFPGESVTINTKPLNSAEGDLLTVDNLRHSLRWGTDLLQGDVSARIRNTEQKTLSFSIPQGANLKNLNLDGAVISSVAKDNTHSILVSPGEHDLLFSYDTFWKPSNFAKMPEIKLDARLHNVNLQITPSSDRWILYTGGLVWGPAVLFWPKLVIIILILLSLTKLGYLPLSRAGAVMISLGLAVLPTIFMAIPLIWLAIINAPTLVLEKSQKLNGKIRLSIFIVLSVITVCLMYRMVHSGLILQPPMLVVGNSSSYSNLNWFIDHSNAALPQPWVISLPMWCWRVLMLVWSTWLVIVTIGWTKKAIETGKTLA